MVNTPAVYISPKLEPPVLLGVGVTLTFGIEVNGFVNVMVWVVELPLG